MSFPPANPLHVAMYLHDLTAGGAERVAVTLMRHFTGCNVRVSLLLHQETGALRHLLPPPVEVHVLNGRRALSDLLPLAAFLRRANPDVLVTYLQHDNIVALLAKRMSRARTRVAIGLHNTLSWEAGPTRSLKFRALPIVYRALRPFLEGIVAVSEGVADDFAEVVRIPRERISCIYDPVIDEEFEQRAREPVDHPWLTEAARAATPVFVTAARLITQKDIPTLLRAFAKRRQLGPARLIVLGDGPERAPLTSLAEELRLNGDVDFKGYVANVLPYFREASAFVMTSRYEGFGLVLVEAMGCGTPVISTECPFGPAEILDNGRFGCLVPVGDVDGLTAAMTRDLRAVWPSSVLRQRASLYSAEASRDAYLKFFEQLCSQSVPGEAAESLGVTTFERPAPTS